MMVNYGNYHKSDVTNIGVNDDNKEYKIFFLASKNDFSSFANFYFYINMF